MMLDEIEIDVMHEVQQRVSEALSLALTEKSRDLDSDLPTGD